MHYVHEFLNYLVSVIGAWGCPGIFILMAIESSVLPLPSEVVMIPAGYLASQGQMNLGLALFCGTAGSVVGALVNYYASMWVGRAFILRYGKYFFVKEEAFLKLEQAFLTHGNFATFVGRLIFGVRHLISIPAGLSRLPLKQFVFYTAAGAAIWCTILLALGYVLGTGDTAMATAKLVGYWLLGFIAIMTAAYIRWCKKKKS